MHRILVVSSIAVLAIGGSTACATKKFVRTNVGEVNEKVDSLGKSVEQTQERTWQNENRIKQVDQRAQAAQQSGHSVGSKIVNQKIGLERAEAVERYLHECYQVPLHRMNVISYGEDRPVAPNKTRAGRAQNRRVVIRVLA